MSIFWGGKAGRLVGPVGLSVAIGLVGCSQDSVSTPTQSPTAERLDVVATNSILCDLTQQIAQDTVALTCLMEPGQDPHTYQVQPSDRQALEAADLIFYGGYNSAPGIIQIIAASRNTKPQVAVYEAAVPEPLMVEAHAHDHAEHEPHQGTDGHAHDHDAHDHGADKADADVDVATDAQADMSPVPDPHVWHSAANSAEITEVIAINLEQMNPAAADGYRQAADRLQAEFQALHDWIATQMTTVPAENRELITPHAAFNYYADAYDLRVKGALTGLSNHEQPTASGITDLVERVKAAEVPAIFAETTTAPDLIQTLAREAGVEVAPQPLYVEGPAGDAATPTLQAMLVSNTCTIVNALGGRCDPATAPVE